MLVVFFAIDRLGEFLVFFVERKYKIEIRMKHKTAYGDHSADYLHIDALLIIYVL